MSRIFEVIELIFKYPKPGVFNIVFYWLHLLHSTEPLFAGWVHPPKLHRTGGGSNRSATTSTGGRSYHLHHHLHRPSTSCSEHILLLRGLRYPGEYCRHFLFSSKYVSLVNSDTFFYIFFQVKIQISGDIFLVFING